MTNRDEINEMKWHLVENEGMEKLRTIDRALFAVKPVHNKGRCRVEPGHVLGDKREVALFTECNTFELVSATEIFAWMAFPEPPKPEVDWNNVPVDTLVRVRNRESEDWRLMHFKELRTDYVFKRHITWKNGKTSKTAEGDCVGWQYCELVEDEEDGK